MESKTTHIDMKKAKVEMLISSSENFRRYHESGDNTRLSKLVSMMYLLNTCTNELRMEADEILDRYEIKRGKIKTLSNNSSSRLTPTTTTSLPCWATMTRRSGVSAATTTASWPIYGCLWIWMGNETNKILIINNITSYDGPSWEVN